MSKTSKTVCAIVTDLDWLRLNSMAGRDSLSTFLRGLINDGLEQEGQPPLQELLHEPKRRLKGAGHVIEVRASVVSESD